MATRRDLLRATAALPFIGTARAHAAIQAKLACEPLAGHFTHNTVRIWLQADASVKARITYWPAKGAPEDSRSTTAVPLEAQRADSAVLEISNLRPDTRYEYFVSLGAQRANATRFFRTAPAPGTAPAEFRIYLGSCAYTEAMSPNGNPYGDEFHIFDTIAANMQADALPHLMLWLGDNLYLRPNGKFLGVADFDSAERMAARYREVRSNAMLQKLFAATHHYAIWDDHDYGPNNSGKTFRFKADALGLFRQYWPNPDMGSPELPGTWTSFKHQDAEFFLLDDRYYRDDEQAPVSDDKAMFGPRQMAWLKSSLAKSKATFKLVCNGSQLLSEDQNGKHSGWHSYPAERADFLAWLATEKIPGMLFLSGDRHNTQVFRLKQAGAPVVYEYSCSPLTARLSKLSKTDRANPRFVNGLGVERRNFGTLEFAGAGASRKIVAGCFDSNGKKLWERTLASARTDPDGEPI
jgi:alkaline phosphatase D